MKLVILISAAIHLISAAAHGETASSGNAAKPLPSGFGLAAKYPGDKGIEKDPDVVFVEDFEAASTEDVYKRWDSVKAKSIISLSKDVPAGSAGKHSLLMSYVGGM